MHHFIDRRQNPKGKSLGNRQRFLRRTRHQVKEMVERAMTNRSIKDVQKGEKVTIPTKGIDEPRFSPANGKGQRDRIFPGNKEFVVGDKFKRPEQGGAGQGKEGSADGEGEDDFSFTLTRDEFLDILFDDLALPDLVKTSLTDANTLKMRRAGIASHGTQANMNILRTMRHAYGRRLALNRPSKTKFAKLEEEIAELEAKDKRTKKEEEQLKLLREKRDIYFRKRKAISFIDPVDARYNYFKPEPVPSAKAVMFCLMDVSGSMGEREKNLAKRFFILLHLFLDRCYEKTEIVFIRHTHYAQEVDEETFFYGRETGGTVVSTALTEMERVVAERYPTSDWNIYVAQASDGENLGGDSKKCQEILQSVIMPSCQYYAYVEILDESDTELLSDGSKGADLWQTYLSVHDQWDNFQMCRVAEPNHIYPIFRKLFAKRMIV